MSSDTPSAPEERRARLVRVLTALGATDPDAWADSEAGEDIPQLARFLLLHGIWCAVKRWEDPATLEPFRADPRTAELMAQLDAAGVAPETLALFARQVAHETAFDLAYRLGDPDFVDTDPVHPEGFPPKELRGELPGWCLLETTPSGKHTGRHIDGLYEDIGADWEEFAGEFERGGGV